MPGRMFVESVVGSPWCAQFYRYLGDRLRVSGAMPVPPLPDLVRQAAATA